MHAEINVRFAVSIAKSKRYRSPCSLNLLPRFSLRPLSSRSSSEASTSASSKRTVCEKHARGNGDCRFQHAGTSTRTAVTPQENTNSTFTTSKTLLLPTTIRPISVRSRILSTLMASASVKKISCSRLPNSLLRSTALDHDGQSPSPRIRQQAR